MVQTHRSECPLCRFPFDKDLRLSLNTELRDLIDVATRPRVDQSTQEDPGAYADCSFQVHNDAEECPATPSAPPLMPDSVVNLDGVEPPVWMPDSSSLTCMDCRKPFLPLVQLRHHCRMCGGLFCHDCSSTRCFLPPSFLYRYPQTLA